MATYKSDITYRGEETIVVSIDIGTTHTAVTFSHVYPGDKPDVRSVLKWPGQEDAAGDSKIPTLMAYQDGELRFCGAEALDYLDDAYEIARWFKLHLHPESMKTSGQAPAYGSRGANPVPFEIPELPLGISLDRVYTDFLKYVYQATRNYFVNGTPNGSNIWRRLEDQIIIIMCTPNGWDVSQHAFLRKVTISAGLVNELDADQRLEFITEGEASVHYALAHTKSVSWLEKGRMFVVTDAGGSTVDSILYECKSLGTLVLEEVCASECVQAGGVFVDRAAQTLLTQKLGSSRYGGEDWVLMIVRSFEKKTKRVFDGTQSSNVLAFGGPGDNDREKGILRGKLSLTKQEVSNTFEDVIKRIEESCLKLLQGRKVQHLLLVGGFGESPYLRDRLRHVFDRQGTEVVTVEEPSKKAAAEGATIWFIKQLVKARAARCTIGMNIALPYDHTRHHERSQTIFQQADGLDRVMSFDTILERNLVLSKDWRKVNSYWWSYTVLPTQLADTSLEVFAWDGTGQPTWVKSLNANMEETRELMPGMRRLCTLRANMTGLLGSFVQLTNPNGEPYFHLDFQVVMSFKRAKLEARLVWKEKGRTREGTVSILPEDTF